MEFGGDILTKEVNFKHWTGGGFGNRLRAWKTVADWADSSFQGRVVLRCLGTGGGFCAYNLTRGQVPEVLRQWLSYPMEEELSVMVNEAAPDDRVVLQGEFLNTPPYIFLYSTARAHMRPALAERSATVVGWQGIRMLRKTMTPSSWSDFEVLLDLYPDHVLEVSIYSRNLGDIPGRNALVWEVRKY